MRGERFRVDQGLRVTAVTRTDHRVTVRVRQHGGAERCINFALADRDAARRAEDRLVAWHQSQRALTYVRRAGDGALLDDEEAFRLAYGDEPSDSTFDL
jgi:hypothetical protein